jgi:protein phosphatase
VTSLINKFLRRKSTQNSPQSLQKEETEHLLPDVHQPGFRPETDDASPLSLVNPNLVESALLVGMAQSIGIQRDHNEDAIFTLTTNLISGERKLKFGLYIVADGMGGHENGEIASNIAVGSLSSYIVESLYLPLLSSSPNNVELSIQEIMQTGVLASHQAIKKDATGGGSTLTAALILGDQMTIAHVGDSRAYSINPGENLKLLTQDHSLVKRLEEIGQISAEQASTHPQRNVLYRALGQGETFESDISSFHLHPGSQLILCTDGLWGVVSEKVLEEVIHTAPGPQIACQSLINLANSAGGPDNISVIIVRVPD